MWSYNNRSILSISKHTIFMSFKNIQYKEKLIQKIFKMLKKAGILIFLNICFINLNIKFVANHMVHAWLPP